MLLDIVLAVAPIVVAVPALVALLTTHVSYASKGHLQKRLYGSLLLAEKLPAGTPGARQIAHDIDRQTLHLAYLAQYPHRAREIVDIALIGVGLIGGLVAYYFLLWAEAPLLYLLAFLGLVVLAALWFERAMVNFARNDPLVRELFEHFGAPDNLVRPRTELVAKAPTLTTSTVFERAADFRDAHHRGPMTTPHAVNSVFAQAHSRGARRRELRGLVHRSIRYGLPGAHQNRCRAGTYIHCQGVRLAAVASAGPVLQAAARLPRRSRAPPHRPGREVRRRLQGGVARRALLP